MTISILRNTGGPVVHLVRAPICFLFFLFFFFGGGGDEWYAISIFVICPSESPGFNSKFSTHHWCDQLLYGEGEGG